MSSSAILKKLKDLDAHPKTLDDFKVRTLGGGTVSIISYVIMFVLCVSEVKIFVEHDVEEELFVDTTREPKLQINLNFTLPAMSCNYIFVDAVDSFGEQHLKIDHKIYKRSLDMNGNPIREPQKEELNKRGSSSAEKAAKKCGSCYGAESVVRNITCCNTCADVRNAYSMKKWSFHPENIEQCKHMTNENVPNEGCNIYGSLEVNRVAGSFHIAPGHSFLFSQLHVHDIEPFRSVPFNTSHVVEHLSFGFNIPGRTNPLDGAVGLCTQGMMLFEYYVKIVPTLYYNDPTGKSILTNQFSVTRHEKSTVNLPGMPPGIIVSYELSPIMVKITERRRSLGRFFTNVFAIIGGVFTVASLIDGFLYRSVQAFEKKIILGKRY